jgi:branched-chain amino acid transport system ATP-binding protein
MTSQGVAAEAGVNPGAPFDRTSDGSVLEVRHISASYGPYRALFDVSFEIPAGGVLALIGSNGAGKSTVARTVTGLVTASEGSVSIQGTDVTRMSAWRIARLGVAHVVEGRGIFSSLSVEENLVLVFRQRGGRQSVSDNLERAYAEFPILKDRRKQVAGTLSGGQQRILSLAKVLVVPPKLLVADELSLGLAPIIVDAVYEALEAINRNGTAMLVVEQQVDRVLKLASKALVLDRGRVVYDGSPSGAATAIDELLSRREEAGARAAALVGESKGIPDTAEIAEAVAGEPAGASGPEVGAPSRGDEPGRGR